MYYYYCYDYYVLLLLPCTTTTNMYYYDYYEHVLLRLCTTTPEELLAAAMVITGITASGRCRWADRHLIVACNSAGEGIPTVISANCGSIGSDKPYRIHP
jgi:hypothetical protein